MEPTFEQLFKDNYADLYAKFAPIANNIADQRYFENTAWATTLTPWDNEKLWRMLLEELNILSHAMKRGDTDHISTYELLLNTQSHEVDSLFIKPFDLFYKSLTNFVATYPALSYALIIFNRTYELAIAGDHRVFIRQMVNDNKYLETLIKGRRCFNAFEFVHYARSLSNIKLLLDIADPSHQYNNYINIAELAQDYNNVNVMIELFRRVNMEKKRKMIEYIIYMNDVNLFEEAISSTNTIINKKLVLRIVSIGSGIILNSIVKNVVISDTVDEKDSVTIINIPYNTLHHTLCESVSVSSVLPALIGAGVKIKRFNDDEEDLLWRCIRNNDWEGVKMLVNLGVDIQTEVINIKSRVKASPLILILNSATAANDLKEFMITLYDVERILLFYSCIKYKYVDALKYLIDHSNFNTSELYGSLRYGNMEINTLILDKLGVEYNGVSEVPKMFAPRGPAGSSRITNNDPHAKTLKYNQ